jgi:outer membrane protein
LLLSGLVLTLAAAHASALDLFGTDALVAPASTASLGHTAVAACDPLARPTATLTLAHAIEFALCNNPLTHRDWANAKVMAAQVGLAKANFLPQITATSAYQKSTNVTTVAEDSFYNQDIKSSLRSNRVDLNLVLFDFGQRSAGLRSARELLNAANAAHDATLQTVFINAAQSYYDAITSQSSVLAIRSSKTLAEQSFKVAEAKFKIGLGTMVEKLQAETAFAQETLKLVKAEGNLQVAYGNLAMVMGFSANTPLTIDMLDAQRLPDTGFTQSVDALMDQAKLTHPNLLAARAQVNASKANEDSARASGLPVVSLTASSSRMTQPSLQLGLPPLTTATRGSQYGLQVTIPLGDGISRSYRVRQAVAQTEAKSAELDDMSLQVSLGVWKSFQALQTATEELRVSEQFRASAAKTVDASRSRYEIGATEVLELLNAQSVLANADQQNIQALADWRTARLRLAHSLGMLDSLALQ